MQELWQLRLDWDEEVPTEARQKWLKLVEEVSILIHIRFDWCLTPSEVVGAPKLIVFCDASCQAFGACAYARWKLWNGKFGARFVAAKSRVTPLKELTIPHLKLKGAVLVYRLGKTILEESRLTFEGVHQTVGLYLPGFRVLHEVISRLCHPQLDRYRAIQSRQIGRTAQQNITSQMISRGASPLKKWRADG